MTGDILHCVIIHLTKLGQNIVAVCKKLSTPHDSQACKTTFSCKLKKKFCLTFSVSIMVVEEFWPTKLYSVVSVHWGL